MWGEGTVLAGRYQLRQRIGGGSMGDVWRALDTVLGREVAVKILLPALLDDAGFAARFHTEARVLAALSHPGIVSVFDYGEADDPRTAFLVMELISGRPLSDLLDESAPLSEATTLTVVAQTLEALQAAHDRGIVHRDVKPANLMLRGGSVVVTDFGVARTADARRLTAADVVLGTAVYAAPEQARHTAVTAAADQYAVGVIAYECLTGTPPFDGGTPLGIMMKHLQEPVPPLPETVSAPVRELVMRALAKDPGERFASAREMAEAARRLAAGGGGVTRIGVPQDSFQTGVDVAGVEAAAAGLGSGGKADGDFLSFVVVPRGDEDESAGDTGGSAELSAAGGEASAAASETEEIAPAWASYAVRPQAEGADWASFTVRAQQEDETVPLPDGEAAVEKDAAEAVEPPGKVRGGAGRVVPQDSFTAGVEIPATAEATEVGGPAVADGGRWRSRAVPQDSFTSGVELDEEPAETGPPARGGLSGLSGLGGRWRKRNSSARAADQEEVPAADPAGEQAESTADLIREPADTKPEADSSAEQEPSAPEPGPAPRIAPGHAMPLDSFNAGVELDPEDDAPSNRVVPQDSFTVLGSDTPESAEPESEPADPSARLGRRRAVVLAAVGAVVVGAVAVAYPFSHTNSSADAAVPSTSGTRVTSVTSESSTSPVTSQPPTSAALVPPPVSSSSPAVPHKSGSITNVGDGDVIDVFGNSAGSPIYSDGASLTVEPQAGRTGQTFQATALTSNGQAVYEFGDGLSTDQLIDGSGGSVRLEHCACGSPAQMWWLSQDVGMPSGAFAIHNQGANQCLTDNGASNALSLKPCVAGNKAQQWYLP